MKTLLRLTLLPLLVATVFAAAPVNYKDHIGIQFWSLRAQFQSEGVAATLDRVKAYGITEIETYGVPGVTVEDLAKEMKARGLKATAAHMGYPALKADINLAIKNAKTLGVSYIIIPSLPKQGRFTEENAHAIAADFNTFGAAINAAGLKFGYHPHGFEFTPSKEKEGDVVFDILVRETKPELVSFELDVFWAFHAGQDPVKLLNKYPNRWVALHVKDMRKGAVTGLSTGSAPPTDAVAVGSGQIDWPAILRTARALGIQHYFIEDETPTPLQCIPDTLKYLRDLKL